MPGMTGRKHSSSTIAKMRASAIARGISKETRAKLDAAAAARRGKPGRKLTAEEREHLRIVHTGMKHSAEACERIGASKRGTVRSEESKRKTSVALKGHAVPPDRRLKIAASLTGRKRPEISGALNPMQNPVHRAKYDASVRRGKDAPAFGRTPAHKRGRHDWYAGVCFRSTWEVRFAKSLDARGMEWEYEKQRFNLGSCTYLPDFYLPEEDAYFEVKGWMNADSVQRIYLFRQQHPETPLVVVTKPVLELFESSIKTGAEMAKLETENAS